MEAVNQSIQMAWSRSTGRAFTLIELLIIMAILGILAALVVPVMSNTSDVARIEALATNAAHIRGLIVQHAGKRDVPLSAGGYPLTIDAAWFRSGNMPAHSWTGRAMVVQVVNTAGVLYPAVKTFDPTTVGAVSVWYNTANGAFCALVPIQKTPAETLQVFNDANKVSAASLAATS